MFTYFCRNNFSVVISRCLLLTFVVLLPFIGGCGEDDNPIVDEHDHEEEEMLHADADGFVLEVNETEVYRQFQGTQTGSITLGVGEEIEVHAVFLNASGAEVHVGEEEGEDEHGHDEEETFSLSLTGYDPAVIDIHLSEGEDGHEGEEHEDEEHEGEEHGEEGFGRFEVVGLKAGTTQITLQLLHGDHPDFTAALPIPVTVQ